MKLTILLFLLGLIGCASTAIFDVEYSYDYLTPTIIAYDDDSADADEINYFQSNFAALVLDFDPMYYYRNEGAILLIAIIDLAQSSPIGGRYFIMPTGDEIILDADGKIISHSDISPGNWIFISTIMDVSMSDSAHIHVCEIRLLPHQSEIYPIIPFALIFLAEVLEFDPWWHIRNEEAILFVYSLTPVQGREAGGKYLVRATGDEVILDVDGVKISYYDILSGSIVEIVSIQGSSFGLHPGFIEASVIRLVERD